MAANRVGKTVAGAYETTCHLTGRYPDWWQGKRFEHAPDGWACGANSQTTRDVVQGVLLGKSTGQGMIPVEAIVDSVAGRGITGSIETLWVRHLSGRIAKLGFKTYEQGRRAFEGEAKDFIWCDEEPPIDVYVEMLYRLLTTKGLSTRSRHVQMENPRSAPERSTPLRNPRSRSRLASFQITGHALTAWTSVGIAQQ
jgi:hypothetical protein